MKDILVAGIMSYLLGAVPIGRMLTRLHSGEDVWEYGNGTATFGNLLAILGSEIALLKALGDFLKGVTVAVLAKGAGFEGVSLWLILVALLYGYCKPLGTIGKEGDGVVPGLGYLWLVWPEVGGLILAVFLGTLMMTRNLKYAGCSIIPSIVLTGVLAGDGWATLTALTIILVYLGNLPKRTHKWTLTGSGGKA